MPLAIVAKNRIVYSINIGYLRTFLRRPRAKPHPHQNRYLRHRLRSSWLGYKTAETAAEQQAISLFCRSPRWQRPWISAENVMSFPVLRDTAPAVSALTRPMFSALAFFTFSSLAPATVSVFAPFTASTMGPAEAKATQATLRYGSDNNRLRKLGDDG